MRPAAVAPYCIRYRRADRHSDGPGHVDAPPLSRHAVQRHPRLLVPSGASPAEILFQSGRRYNYHGVPAGLAEAMRQAFSKGVFFNAHIRDHFRYSRETG